MLKPCKILARFQYHFLRIREVVQAMTVASMRKVSRIAFGRSPRCRYSGGGMVAHGGGREWQGGGSGARTNVSTSELLQLVTSIHFTGDNQLCACERVRYFLTFSTLCEHLQQRQSCLWSTEQTHKSIHEANTQIPFHLFNQQ